MRGQAWGGRIGKERHGMAALTSRPWRADLC
jgi:hypothetical protein